MSNYFVGDIHGCYDELKSLLKKVFFNPNKDTLWVTGDLVFKGGKTLDVIRYIRSLGTSARVVLGNHDIFFIAIYLGIINLNLKENLSDIFLANDIVDLVNWMRYQPLVQIDNERKIIMVHAGVHPQWNINKIIYFSKLIGTFLSSSIYNIFLDYIYNKNIYNTLFKSLNFKKLNFILNVFTKIRFCLSNGNLDMSCKLTPAQAPSHLKPWFLKLNMIPDDYRIIFGHWSSLMNIDLPAKVVPLDTGCCWGRYLTIFRLEDKKFFTQKSFFNI